MTVSPCNGKISVSNDLPISFSNLQPSGSKLRKSPECVFLKDGKYPFHTSHIIQFDGNNTLSESENEYDITGLTEEEIYIHDPALIETGYSVQAPHLPSCWQNENLKIQIKTTTDNLNYEYAINKDNQSNRL